MRRTQPDSEALADMVAAENVRRLMDGTLDGEPLQGTLAWRVWAHTWCLRNELA